MQSPLSVNEKGVPALVRVAVTVAVAVAVVAVMVVAMEVALVGWWVMVVETAV